MDGWIDGWMDGWMLCDIRYADYRLGACIALSQASYLMRQHQSYLSMSALKDPFTYMARDMDGMYT